MAEGEIPEGICINGGNLQTLILNNNFITGSLPRSIVNCTNLIWVSLSRNRISAGIPSDIGNLANLAILQLAKNTLRQVPKPEELSGKHAEIICKNGAIVGFEVGSKWGCLDGLVENLGISKQEEKGRMKSQAAHPFGVLPQLVLPDIRRGLDQPRSFTYRELQAATNNFNQAFIIGIGGFGSVFKGRSRKTGQYLAVKQLNRQGLQGQCEFLVEVLMLSLAKHENIIRMFGYCDDAFQRLIVYEYMPMGCLVDHLHELTPDMLPLNWETRMRIAAGVARALNYLHNRAVPPIILGDLKPSNILLGGTFDPKLSDFGLAKFGDGDNWNVVSSGTNLVTGTAGYCAPERTASGELTFKTDIYSFGVVLLELITGREALELDANQNEESIVDWAQKKLRFRTILDIADPNLYENFKLPMLKKAMSLAFSCVQDDPALRPSTADVLQTINKIAFDPADTATFWRTLRRTPERGSTPGARELLNPTSGRRRAYSR
ncbi:Serine/threonine-protein kinase PBL27 [Sesamum alatum]|uniref:Serine/threonine-protein kinase PBL27 n=1 Tax=Sesamum alatum TaxID=300844 RepID=A0AAE1XUN4_9LAMI|nr:Serine/threonine-protein kinase PBL27 [Sesamum alatum]